MKAYNQTNKRSISFFKIIVFIVVAVLLLVCAGEFMHRQNMRMYPKKYGEYVKLYSDKYNIDENIVYAVIRTESGFDPDAYSSAGAIGLMQITPDTYDWLLYLRKEEKLKQLYDIETNIDFGTYFLSCLYEKFGNWETVFAAYNAGLNRVSQWLENPEYAHENKLIHIPFTETRNYVKKVSNTIIKYRQIYD